MGVRVPCDVVSRDVYTTVTGLAASGAGDLVVSGDCFGRLAVFNSDALLGPDNEDESDTDCTPPGGQSVHHSRPSVALCTRYGPVQQLVSNGERHLMAVCGNSVNTFQWSDIATAAAAAAATGTTDNSTSCKPPRAVWSITAGSAGLGGIESADVCGADGQLCVAAGGSVLVYCQETRQLVHRLASGRSRDPAAVGADTVRCVRCVRAAPWSHAATAELVTCGDDGCVRVWDLRCPRTPTAQLVPPHSSSSSGGGGGACEKGSRLNAVDAVGEWVVCGGRAPASTVFHRRSTGVLTTLVPDTTITTTTAAAVTNSGAPAHTHVTRFVDASGAVAVARNCAGVEIYSSTTTTTAAANGDGGAICRPTTTLDTSATAVFALLVLPPLRRRQLILAAGCGAQLDVCTAQYRDVTVSCLSPVVIPV